MECGEADLCSGELCSDGGEALLVGDGEESERVAGRLPCLSDRSMLMLEVDRRVRGLDGLIAGREVRPDDHVEPLAHCAASLT